MLEPQPAGGPRDLKIVSEHLGSIFLHDVLFGDVFICGGQSNMQMGMADANWEDMTSINEMAKDGSLENIRIFTVATDPYPAGTGTDPAQALPTSLILRHNWTKYNSLPTLHGWLPVTPYTIYGPTCAKHSLDSCGGWSKWYYSDLPWPLR